MNISIYTLGLKQLMGQALTDDEKDQIKAYDRKYTLVRALYLEKRKFDGKNLSDFHFTPGDKFMDIPVVDIVNSLLDIALSEAVPYISEGGPKTGLKKVRLTEEYK